MSINVETLRRQDDVTSAAALAALDGCAAFVALSAAEGQQIVQRDAEDDAKLARGIELAVARGVLPANPDVAPVTKVHVHDKSADEVADEVMTRLPKGSAAVLILQGLSGTGKGTTVKKLQGRLPKCVCWSNGNVFRTLTHLANEHCEKTGTEFGPELFTKEFVAGIFERLTFEPFGEVFDVVIDGSTRVSTVQDTVLKAPLVATRVPTAAGQTQGEVVKFAAAAVATMQAAGCNVILEGRAQTLQYIPTPFRFELVIDDAALLGRRRAAQRVVADANANIAEGTSVADVKAALTAAAEAMAPK